MKKKGDCFFILPWRGWTKGNCIISGGTCKSTGSIIVSVAIRSGTSSLEHLRVNRGPASSRWPIRAAAAVLRATKSLTRALTRAPIGGSKLSRALPVQIGGTPGWSTHTRPAISLHDHRQVVTVDEAHVVEVLPQRPQRELGECYRRCSSGAVAFEVAGAAVSGETWPGTGSVEVATGSSPETTGPACWCLEGAWSVLGKLETGAVERWATGICENAWPHSVIAPVYKCEGSTRHTCEQKITSEVSVLFNFMFLGELGYPAHTITEKL